MADIYGGKAHGSIFGSPAPAKGSSHGGPFGFVGNLAHDIKDAVVGLPMGLVQTVEHPIRSVENMARASWMTWSPLFEGHFKQFAKQTYDHPLAPLLDVMTVFSLGASGAASLGAKVGAEEGLLAKAAALKVPRDVKLTDPTGAGRHDLAKSLSVRPGRRVMQEALLSMEPHLPMWAGGAIKSARYESAFLRDMGGRVGATNMIRNQALANGAQINALMQAGKILEDPETAATARQGILTGMYLNLTRHAPVRTADDAEALAKIRTGHYTAVVNPAFVRGADSTASLARRLQSQINTTERTVGAGGFKAIGAQKRLSDLRAQMSDLEQRSYREHFSGLAASEEMFNTAVENFGRVATTRNLSRAARDSQGRLMLVPRHDAKMLGWEARDSSRAVRWLWKNPTRTWKMIQVGYTPRTITNNAVGNWFLYATRESPVSGTAAVADAIRVLHGDATLEKAVDLGTPFKRKHWLYKQFGDELGNTFGNTLGDAPGRARSLAQQGLYGIVHKTSDEPVRAAAIMAYLRRDPAVQAQMEKLVKGGLTKSKAFDRAVTYALRRNSSLRNEAALHARRTAGDYFTVRPGFERVLHGLIPFYLWDRHILRTTANLVADNPGRVAAAQMISNEGIAQTRKILGDIPEFLHNAIPLGSNGSGRSRVLLTYSLNPFATLGDLAEAAQGLTTGGGRTTATAIGQANPMLGALIESVSGQSLLSGAQKPTHGGILPTILANVGGATPPVALAKALTTKDTAVTPKGNDFLYAKDDLSPVSSLFGVPVRNVSQQRAAELAAQEKTGKKTKRKKTIFG